MKSGPISVVLADDHPVFRMGLTYILQKAWEI